ncbi:glycosyltransferase [Neobacillus niacini]|uniref:glycosyltransferase n=1 Tax=Neobacillus niacini TaxID=86668 RepID=UPI003B0174F9
MKITMVIVLYKLKPEASKTFQTLMQALSKNNQSNQEIKLLLYDNSPSKHDFNPLNYEGIHISYHHDPRNLGIATAYNFAWSVAKQNGSTWLLLLDHDTEITVGYLHSVFNHLDMPSEVVAVIPKINSENIMISPVVSDSLRPLKEARPVPGLQEKPVMAINSGTLITINFLNEINGFNKDFPLDYLDHWLFFEIYHKGRKVWLMDATLEHELSVMDYSRVSLDRYRSILDSEKNFYLHYKKELWPSYRRQLAKRFLKQMVTVKNKKIAMCTLKGIFS